MLCPNCGKYLEEGTRFCSGCGSPVGMGQFSPQVKRKTEEEIRKYRKIGMIAVGSCAFLILFLAVLLYVTLRTPGYERPIKYFLEGIEDADAERMLKGMPEIYWKMKEDSDWTQEEWTEACQEELDERREGIHLRLSYEVAGKKKLNYEHRTFWEKRMEEYGLEDTEITEGYQLTIKVTVESKDHYRVDDFMDDFFLDGDIRGNSLKMSVSVGKVGGEWGILGGLLY
ncbi:zinc-ribbon domain-containing protein [Hominifimenecus sp. rT4P-3]|uniref:zinc-ribbon domain-containing protein n=1 Tax=Hominifimenecus sp. rT4P-3 TaxID=3242979 RepID=UPI003DA3F9B0